MLKLGSSAKSVRPGKVYGAPGDGYSSHISVLTAVVLVASAVFALWVVFAH